MASEENGKKTVPENVEDKPASTVSEHKTNNQQDSKKGTQPARRKAKSTFQPGYHGRLVQYVMFDKEGKAVKGLENLFESLADRFDYDDVVNALLIELAVTDYWRQSKAVQYELNNLCSNGWGFHPKGEMPAVTRYLTTSRRNLDKSLQMLLQLEKEAAEAEAFEAESEATETEASAVDAASPSQPTPTPAKADEQSPPAASTTPAHEAAAAEPQPTAAESAAAEGAAETPAAEGAGEKPAADLPDAA